MPLSQSMRDLLSILSELTKMIREHNSVLEVPTKSTVFEDNNGARILVTSPKMTLCSKHITASKVSFLLIKSR